MNTEILYLNDKSSSMTSLREAVISGFNAFLADQKTQPGLARITHVQFSDAYNRVCRAEPVTMVPPLTPESYLPFGSTALYDALGTMLEEEGKRIADEKWADQVIVAINTDGEENASKHYNQEQIRTMITHAQTHGWIFIFMAANQDAFKTGGAMGIAPQYTRNFVASAAGMTDNYLSTSAMVSTLRGGNSAPEAWADALKPYQNTPTTQA